MSEENLIRNMFSPAMIQEIMSLSAENLMQGNEYTKEFEKSAQEVRKRLQQPRQQQERAKSKRDGEEYKRKFQEDIENIKKRIYGEKGGR